MPESMWSSCLNTSMRVLAYRYNVLNSCIECTGIFNLVVQLSDEVKDFLSGFPSFKKMTLRLRATLMKFKKATLV